MSIGIYCTDPMSQNQEQGDKPSICNKFSKSRNSMFLSGYMGMYKL